MSTTPLALLRSAHRRGRLLPLLREAAAEELAVAAARDAGLSVTADELQAAADEFRRRNALSTAAATRSWLERLQLSADDLQAVLEADLLLAKFMDRLLVAEGPARFAADPERHSRARLRLLVAASEGEARERLSQLLEDGRDFAELARQHSLHATKAAGGDLGPVPRRGLPGSIAEAVFSARAGDHLGPFPGEGGWCVFRVESLSPPDYADAAPAIRAELFDAWLRARLAAATTDTSWLGAT